MKTLLVGLKVVLALVLLGGCACAEGGHTDLPPLRVTPAQVSPRG